MKTTILLKVIFWYWHPFSKPLVLSQSHVLLVERTVLLIVVLFGSPIWSPELKQWCESWGNHQGSSKIAPFQESIKKSRKSGVKKSIFDFGFLVVAFHEISLLKLCETTSVTPRVNFRTSELISSKPLDHVKTLEKSASTIIRHLVGFDVSTWTFDCCLMFFPNILYIYIFYYIYVLYCT